MKTGRKVFWGVLLLLGAVALLVGRLGFLEGIGFWSIIFTIALIGTLVDGVLHRSFGMILFSAAFLVIVNDKLLGLEAITPWPVLGAALLGTIGLGILFPQKKWEKKYHGKAAITAERAEVIEGGEMLYFENTFSECVKYIASPNLHSVDIENAFGSVHIYLDNATLQNHRGRIHVDGSFGTIAIYVPQEWRVLLNVESSFGHSIEKGHSNPQGEEFLEICGEVSFGNLEVIYI